MDEEQMPPLPEPDGTGIDCETDDGSYWYAPAMREYARAAVLAERERIAAWLDWYDGKPTRRGEAVRRGECFDAAAIRGHAEEKQ
jgi:hypothetical protein